jgi:hypothetical protein
LANRRSTDADTANEGPEGALQGDGLANADRTALTGQSGALTGQVRFRQHLLRDPGLDNMPAVSVLAPAGFKVEGGMTRPANQYYSTPVLVDVKFVASDGRQARIMPSFIFEFDYRQPQEPLSPTLNGNMYFPLPESASAWIASMYQLNPDPTIGDFQIVSEEIDEQATEQLQREIATLKQSAANHTSMFGQYGSGQAVDAQAVIVTTRYRQGGLDLEEKILIHYGYSVFATNGQMSSGQWAVSQLASMRGPVGTDYANDPEMLTIFNSVRILPEWQQKMNEYFSELARIRYRGQQERLQQSIAAHQRRMATLNETSDIIAQGWRNRSVIQDRMQRREIDAIHEVTPFASPSGGEIRFPSIYDHVYTDGEGNFIAGENASADPGPGWRRVDPIR